MPYLDFEWPLDRLGCNEALFEDGGLEPYVTELVEAVSVKLRDCLEKSIYACLWRGCTCPLRLQIKVGCWNTDVHSQDSDPESDHPEDASWETLRPCKIIELRGLLGHVPLPSPGRVSQMSCHSSDSEEVVSVASEHGPEPNRIETAPQGIQPDEIIMQALENEIGELEDVMRGPEPIPTETGIESAPQEFQPDESFMQALENEIGQLEDVVAELPRFSDVVASLLED